MSEHYYCCFIGAALALNSMSVLTNEIPRELDRQENALYQTGRMSRKIPWINSISISRFIWADIFLCVILLFNCKAVYHNINHWIMWVLFLPFFLILLKISVVDCVIISYWMAREKLKFTTCIKNIIFQPSSLQDEIKRLYDNNTTHQDVSSHTSNNNLSEIPIPDIMDIAVSDNSSIIGVPVNNATIEYWKNFDVEIEKFTP